MIWKTTSTACRAARACAKQTQRGGQGVAGEKVHKGQFSADTADRYVKELRAEESYFDLVDIYREHIRTALPPA